MKPTKAILRKCCGVVNSASEIYNFWFRYKKKKYEATMMSCRNDGDGAMMMFTNKLLRGVSLGSLMI
jgi:hypothetical protein